MRLLLPHAGGVKDFLCVSAVRRQAGLWLRRRLAQTDPYGIGAAALFAALLILVAATFRDYAVSNDEFVQQRYGEMIVAYYQSGFADQALFHFRDLYLYGGLFDIAAVGLEKLIPLDLYAVRHLFSALWGVGGIVAVWATARLIGGTRAALLAALALSVCGVWYGAMFNHTKDIPFAAAMMGALYVLLLLGRELPRPRWRLIVAFGVLCGFALGLRVLGVFLVGYAGLAVLANLPRGEDGFAWRPAAVFAGRSALAFAPAFAIAYVIMIAVWPWAALAPFNPLRAISAFSNFHYPIHTILDGTVYEMADVPRWYVPEYVVIKLTLPLLIGACAALVLPPRRLTQIENGMRRKETVLIAAAALLPLICNAAVHGPGDTGMRQFLFVVPPIAVLAGLGLNAAFERSEAFSRALAAAVAAVVVAGLGWNAVDLYRLHPDEYLFYNPLVDGLQGASRRYATDYWVNIMPEAVRDLERYLDRAGRASRRPPQRFSVAVCGERASFEDVADSRLTWTPDWKHADFFIAPTHMNCDRALNGRTVATVERLGVLIGVVKDRRAITRPALASAE